MLSLSTIRLSPPAGGTTSSLGLPARSLVVWLLLLGSATLLPPRPALSQPVLTQPVLAQTDLGQPDQAVEAGRESLGGPRWYDAEQDDFRPVHLEPPKNSTPWSTGWDLSFGGWLRFVAWVLFVLLLILVAWLIVRAFLNRENTDLASLEDLDQGRFKPDITRVEELPLVLSTPPEDYLDAAHRHYRRGEFGPAILYLFSHQLLALDRWHWIHLIKGKTNRQYLREVARAKPAGREELASILELTVLLFEEVYFGKRLPPRESIDEAWARIDRFESLVGQATEVAA